jgi:branched-chain amino acid transport system permease protein
LDLINSIAITLISGFILGTIYALMSLGLTLIYGMGNIFNFAHGAFFIWGAYLTWFFTTKLHINMLFAIILAVVLLFLFGLIWEKVALKPKRQNFVSVVTICLGLMMILDSAAHYFFDPTQKALSPIVAGNVSLFFVTRSMNEVVNFITALGILIALWLFFAKTRSGMAIRAVSEDNVGASVIGIDTDKIYTLSFAIGVGLAGLSGILLAPEVYISTAAGGDALLKAVIIVILGGLGSIKGSMYAALILGVMESAVSMYVGMFWVLPSWFFIMVLILGIRPRGLYGTR